MPVVGLSPTRECADGGSPPHSLHYVPAVGSTPVHRGLASVAVAESDKTVPAGYVAALVQDVRLSVTDTEDEEFYDASSDFRQVEGALHV